MQRGFFRHRAVYLKICGISDRKARIIMLDYKSLLPNWWSQAWAKAKLEEFSTEQLNDGCRLLSDG